MERTADLDGRVAVVTGTGAGIGRSIAIGLAARGASVVCAGMDAERNAETVALVAAAGGAAHFVRTDVRLLSDNRQMVQAALAHFGRVDLMVNNAGITPRGAMHEMAADAVDDAFATNVRSIFHSTAQVVPLFLEQGSGSIINTASSYGLLGAAGFAAYCATKGAIVTLTKAMALEYGPTIRVNCVCPGATLVPQVQRFIDASEDPAATAAAIGSTNVALGRMADPDEIAEAFVFLASDASRFMTGHALVIDGGQTVDA